MTETVPCRGNVLGSKYFSPHLPHSMSHHEKRIVHKTDIKFA